MLSTYDEYRGHDLIGWIHHHHFTEEFHSVLINRVGIKTLQDLAYLVQDKNLLIDLQRHINRFEYTKLLLVLGEKDLLKETSFPEGMIHNYPSATQKVTHHSLPVHYDIHCNECKMCPIIGVRYKSIPKDNYNLCSKCEDMIYLTQDHGVYYPMVKMTLSNQHPKSMSYTVNDYLTYNHHNEEFKSAIFHKTQELHHTHSSSEVYSLQKEDHTIPVSSAPETHHSTADSHQHHVAQIEPDRASTPQELFPEELPPFSSPAPIDSPVPSNDPENHHQNAQQSEEEADERKIEPEPHTRHQPDPEPEPEPEFPAPTPVAEVIAAQKTEYRHPGIINGKPVAGSTYMPAPPMPDNRRPPQHSWSTLDSKLFQVRIGPDYNRYKKKAPSSKPLYEVIAVDVFRTKSRIDHVARKFALPDTSHIQTNHRFVPPLFVIQLQIPSEPPPSFFSTVEDGPGWSVVMYYRITEDTCQQLRNLATASPAVKLFAQWCEKAPNDANWRGRFKVICSSTNLNEIGIPSVIESYNGKPILIRKTGTIFRGENYLEKDIHVHKFANMAKQSIFVLSSRCSKLFMQIGFVIEGRENHELPETLFACVGINLPQDELTTEIFDD